MRFNILGAVLLVASLTLQPYGVRAASQCPGNLIPMYGRTDASHVQQERLAADQQVLQKRANDAVVLGWRYFLRDGDPATAMKRFNQAWLLAPDNAGAFHGMAVMSLVLSENPAYATCPFTTEQADTLFQKALNGANASPGAYADYGRFLIIQNRHTEAVASLKMALKLAPDHAHAKLHLSAAYEGVGDYAQACTWAKQAMAALKELPRNMADEVCAKAP